jgi:hypothetical protein
LFTSEEACIFIIINVVNFTPVKFRTCFLLPFSSEAFISLLLSQNVLNKLYKIAILPSVAQSVEGLSDDQVMVQFPVGVGIFFLDIVSRPALGPTQPPIQCVPGALSLG